MKNVPETFGSSVSLCHKYEHVFVPSVIQDASTESVYVRYVCSFAPLRAILLSLFKVQFL